MAFNLQSILDSTKKLLGLEFDYTDFDADVIMHINTAFGVLQQMGVGPVVAYSITDNTQTWSDFSANIDKLATVKSYIYQKVRLMFDPPATSFGIIAVEKVITELEFRLNVMGETLAPPSDPFANA